jgi:predicted DNA-binding transcriptional regulator YafY
LENISQALFRETWLEVDYTNTAGEQRKHRVMPLGLAQQGARMVLVVRFDGHTDARSLAVSRIERAQDTGLPFPPVTDFDLADFEKQGGFGYGQGQAVRITFRIDKALGLFLTESRLSANQTVVDLGDRLEITATVAHTEHLVWWLRGFGSRVEVLAPVQLVQQVQEV